MPDREHLALDPETLDIVIYAFAGACNELGVKSAHLRWLVANKVFELVDKQRDAEALTAAVVAALKCPTRKRPAHKRLH